MRISAHAKSQVLSRVESPKEFMKGMEKGARRYSSFLSSSSSWSVRVHSKGETLGTAVGNGVSWTTTLGPGMQPQNVDFPLDVEV